MSVGLDWTANWFLQFFHPSSNARIFSIVIYVLCHAFHFGVRNWASTFSGILYVAPLHECAVSVTPTLWSGARQLRVRTQSMPNFCMRYELYRYSCHRALAWRISTKTICLEKKSKPYSQGRIPIGMRGGQSLPSQVTLFSSRKRQYKNTFHFDKLSENVKPVHRLKQHLL